MASDKEIALALKIAYKAQEASKRAQAKAQEVRGLVRSLMGDKKALKGGEYIALLKPRMLTRVDMVTLKKDLGKKFEKYESQEESFALYVEEVGSE